jgi:hypothetical protein
VVLKALLSFTMTALLFGGAQAIADSAVDPACIEAVTQKVSSTPVDEHVGLIQPLEKPHPINLKFEIFALSYPRGRQNGPLYHIRVRQDMLTQMVAMEGENFKKETTEYNSATDSLLSTLGYRV